MEAAQREMVRKKQELDNKNTEKEGKGPGGVGRVVG